MLLMFNGYMLFPKRLVIYLSEIISVMKAGTLPFTEPVLFVTKLLINGSGYGSFPTINALF